MINQLKKQIRIIESILTEGDHWPEDYRRKAVKRIRLATDAKTYSDSNIEQDVDKMMVKFKPLLHKNSNVGYFLPVIRMFIDYVGNDKNKRKEFVDTKFNKIVDTLRLISSDPSLELKFKDDIKNRWTLEDFEKHAAELQAEIDKADTAQLASVGNANASNYDLIPINSYEELNEKFGGEDKTGYKGESPWCHTNGKSTYDSWTGYGSKQFFVLAKKGWENIKPPDPKTTNAFDEYGTSLIAILVKVDDCALKNATLRWNHTIDPGKTVPKTTIDNAFLGWGDLSKALGFNVKAAVEKAIKANQIKLKNTIENTNNKISAKLKTITEIDEKTISDVDRRWLTHVEIPDNVTSIGDKAFSECDNLTTVTIPNSVTNIGEWAFFECDNLRSITLPNSITRIRKRALCGCRSLTNLTIPDSVTSLEDYSIAGLMSLTHLTIPDSVTSIGHNAIAGCVGLTSVTIPDSVTSLGAGAFYQCLGLTSITIPNSVKSIGDYAFYNCGKLKNVTIGNSVKSIGQWAFWACKSLTSITIPASVTSIGKEPFKDCNSLTNVTFEGKTMDEVRSMTGYPWGIQHPEEVIRVTDASK